MPKGWNNLSNEQRKILGHMYGSCTDTTLSDFVKTNWDVEITPENLARRIRELRQNAEEFGVDPDSIKFSEAPEQPGLNAEYSVNSGLVTYAGNTAHTLEELLALAKVDLEIWDVQDYLINLWEGFRSNKTSSLTFSEGVMDGAVNDTGGVVVTPLHQVKIRLIRKKPILLVPEISPIKINVTAPIYSVAEKPGTCSMVIPDPQFGFWRDLEKLNPIHDRNALSVALQIATHLQPEQIVFTGDLLDLAEWQSRYGNDPEMFRTTQASLIEAGWWLAQFRAACPNSAISLLEGNHDLRIKTAMANLLPAAYGIRPISLKSGAPQVRLSDPEIYGLKRLLDLPSIFVDYVDGYPDNSVWLNDTLEVVHGDVARGRSGESTAALLVKTQHDVICGHIHRMELTTKVISTRKGQRIITAASPGCLCRIDQVVPGHSKRFNWSQGVAVVEPGKHGNAIYLVPIFNGTAQFRDTSFASDQKFIKQSIKELNLV